MRVIGAIPPRACRLRPPGTIPLGPNVQVLVRTRNLAHGRLTATSRPGPRAAPKISGAGSAAGPRSRLDREGRAHRRDRAVCRRSRLPSFAARQRLRQRTLSRRPAVRRHPRRGPDPDSSCTCDHDPTGLDATRNVRERPAMFAARTSTCAASRSTSTKSSFIRRRLTWPRRRWPRRNCLRRRNPDFVRTRPPLPCDGALVAKRVFDSVR
jgi:hypothetical protein